MLEHVVNSIFPGESIQQDEGIRKGGKRMRVMFVLVSRLNVLDILRDVRKEAKIFSPSTGSPLELDIWIPNLKLCFEFQVPSILFALHLLLPLLSPLYL